MRELTLIERFITDTGVEVPAITTDQMREVDRIAMEETGPNLFQMMENAGRNLALQAIEVLGSGWEKAIFVVLAGTGGNGGGGICAARHLANRGTAVRLAMTSGERLGEIPRFQLKVFQATDGEVIEPSKLNRRPVDLIIDALIGYSLNGAPRGISAELIDWANTSKAPILSLDVPSGVNSTTGETPGAFIQPQCTMTLALPKGGLLPALTGDLYLADIGIPVLVYERLGLGHISPFGNRFRVTLNEME